MEALAGKRVSKGLKPLKKTRSSKEMGVSTGNLARTACSQDSKPGRKWRLPRRLPSSALDMKFSSTPPPRLWRGPQPAFVRSRARGASPAKHAAKTASSHGSAHAPLALFAVGPKPRPLCVLRGGLGAESSRDPSSFSLLQHLVANGAGKRGGAGASAESGGGGGGGRWPV